MWRRILILNVVLALASALFVTGYIAFPNTAQLPLVEPLRALSITQPHLAPYDKDLGLLANGFAPQRYRSFCGPASITTVLRAYGVKRADQTTVFPSLVSQLKVFYSGLSLAGLAELAGSAGLNNELVYADTLNIDTFRERLKTNLSHEGDFILVNYDRRVLKQSGSGHISPVAAYDDRQDAFLILDEAAYKYPFTWVPTQMLFDAIHTRDGDQYRGVLFIHTYAPSG